VAYGDISNFLRFGLYCTSVIAIVRSYPVSSSFLLYFGIAFVNSHHCELLAAAFGPGPLGLQWH